MRRQSDHAWYIANKQHRLETLAEWRQAHPDRVRDLHRGYQRKIREDARLWRAHQAATSQEHPLTCLKKDVQAEEKARDC